MQSVPVCFVSMQVFWWCLCCHSILGLRHAFALYKSTSPFRFLGVVLGSLSRPVFAGLFLCYWRTRLPGLEAWHSPELGVALCAIGPVPFCVAGFLVWLVGAFFILVCWACLCSLVTMSRTWFADGSSVCFGVNSALLLCWLPLFGACVRRCGSCRRFGVFATPRSGVPPALLTLFVLWVPSGFLAAALRC